MFLYVCLNSVVSGNLSKSFAHSPFVDLTIFLLCFALAPWVLNDINLPLLCQYLSLVGILSLIFFLHKKCFEKQLYNLFILCLFCLGVKTYM